MFSDLVTRALPGWIVVIATVAAATRARHLSKDGAAAAAVVGGLAVLAGVSWAVLLLSFFLSASALSRWRHERKLVLLSDITEKGSQRDAVQVLANGGVFAAAALGELFWPGGIWQALAAGAIAAATADTWSTEVGTAVGGTPRHILSGTRMPPGASGSITAVGTAAGATGAIAIAVLAWSMSWPVPLHATIAGGLVGGLVDSLLGATIQERRWCPACGRATERRVHHCGAMTEHRGGVAGFGNDAVNLTSVIAGAVMGGVLSCCTWGGG